MFLSATAESRVTVSVTVKSESVEIYVMETPETRTCVPSSNNSRGWFPVTTVFTQP